MSSQEARYMRKKVTTGEIESDFENLCIIVHYEIEVTIMGDQGEPLQTQKQQNKKVIRLHSLGENSNILLLAQQIVEKCKLIHPNRLSLIEDILRDLRERKRIEDKSVYVEKKISGIVASSQEKEINEVSINEILESCLEKIYDEKKTEKLNAIAEILKLSKKEENLEILIQNETLFGALSRILKEEGQSDTEFGFPIVQIFFCFSHFSQFHGFLSQCRIGDSTFRILDLCVSNYKQALDEFENIKRVGIPKKIDIANKKLEAFKNQVEPLLCVCAQLLLNLAEDNATETKMKKRNISNLLIALLDFDSSDILITSLLFLKKLSLSKETRIELIRGNILPKIVRVLTSANEAVLICALSLLLNLTFEKEVLVDIATKYVLLPRLVQLLEMEMTRIISLKILYQISIDDKYKPIFATCDGITLVLKLILETPANEFVGKELISLAINLCINFNNAELMIADGDGLKLLLQRAKKTWDPLLAKLIRTLSMHPGKCKEIFLNFVPDVTNMMKKCKSDDFLVEMIGTLGNLQSSKYDWAKLISDFELVEFISKHLKTSNFEDDIVLESIVFVGTISQDKSCTTLLVNSDILFTLVKILEEKSEDDDILLQTIFTVFRLLQHKESRNILMSKTQLIPYLIKLLQDKNDEIRKVASLALDIVSEYDKDLATTIREKRFESHNIEWISKADQEEK